MRSPLFNLQREGFTLVEILIVVVIVAILAAIAVPLYLSYVESARAAEAETAISAIWNANKVYYQKYGEYTSDWEGDLMGKGMLNLEQKTLDEWNFTVTGGGNSITSIQATSTSEMEGGAGRVVTFDIKDGSWDGYGHE